MILKFVWSHKIPQIVKTILKFMDKTEGVMLSDLKKKKITLKVW